MRTATSLDGLAKLVALLAPMFPAIWGSATFAMLVSSTSMKAANETTNAINQGFAVGFHGDCGLGLAGAALKDCRFSWFALIGITKRFVSIVTSRPKIAPSSCDQINAV